VVLFQCLRMKLNFTPLFLFSLALLTLLLLERVAANPDSVREDLKGFVSSGAGYSLSGSVYLHENKGEGTSTFLQFVDDKHVVRDVRKTGAGDLLQRRQGQYKAGDLVILDRKVWIKYDDSKEEREIQLSLGDTELWEPESNSWFYPTKGASQKIQSAEKQPDEISSFYSVDNEGIEVILAGRRFERSVMVRPPGAPASIPFTHVVDFVDNTTVIQVSPPYLGNLPKPPRHGTYTLKDGIVTCTFEDGVDKFTVMEDGAAIANLANTNQVLKAVERNSAPAVAVRTANRRLLSVREEFNRSRHPLRQHA